MQLQLSALHCRLIVYKSERQQEHKWQKEVQREKVLLFCGLNLLKQAINMRGNAVNNAAWESANLWRSAPATPLTHAPIHFANGASISKFCLSLVWLLVGAIRHSHDVAHTPRMPSPFALLLPRLLSLRVNF